MPIPRIVKLMGALIVGLAFANLVPLKAFSAPIAIETVTVETAAVQTVAIETAEIAR